MKNQLSTAGKQRDTTVKVIIKKQKEWASKVKKLEEELKEAKAEGSKKSKNLSNDKQKSSASPKAK